MRAREAMMWAAVALSTSAACGGTDNVTIGDDDAGGGPDALTSDGSGGLDGSTSDSTSSDSSAADARPDGAASDASSDGGSGDSGGSPDASPDSAPDAGVVCTVTQTCVAAAPSGFTGPVAFFGGNSAPPSCPSSTTTAVTGGSGLVVPAANCSTCTCDPATGIGCDVTVAIYADSACNMTRCGGATLTSNCSLIPNSCGGVGISIYRDVQGTPHGGSCGHSTQSPTIPPTSWTTNGEACAFNGALTSCGAAQVCAPNVTSPFRLCIYQSGSVSCPSSYPTQQTINTGVSDSRTCTACGCGNPQSSCSGGKITLSPNSSCQAGISSSVPAACMIDGIPSTSPLYGQVTTAPTGSGACPPNGGAPVGTATATNPVTVCCQ